MKKLINILMASIRFYSFFFKMDSLGYKGENTFLLFLTIHHEFLAQLFYLCLIQR